METSKQNLREPAVEEEEYVYKDVQWKDFITKPKYIPWWILSIVILILVILITIFHDPIVDFLRPTSEKLRELPGGWVIPIAILVAISFPPLFGHEIVALLCGVVWGLWIGFGIVAAGTFIGEVGTWFAFKYLFRRKAVKLERTNLNYGSLARVTRDGGFLVVLIIRFSVIPSHFSTAVFSTCDVKFWYFAVATFFTLPKQIILVYFGVLLVQGSNDNTINILVLGATSLVTVLAGVYIYMKMRKTKKVLLAEQSARLDAKQNLAGTVTTNTYARPDDNFWEADRVNGNRTPAAWQEPTYRLDYPSRPVRTQEFI